MLNATQSTGIKYVSEYTNELWGKYGEGINVMLNATQSTGFKKARKKS